MTKQQPDSFRMEMQSTTQKELVVYPSRTPQGLVCICIFIAYAVFARLPESARFVASAKLQCLFIVSIIYLISLLISFFSWRFILSQYRIIYRSRFGKEISVPWSSVDRLELGTRLTATVLVVKDPDSEAQQRLALGYAGDALPEDVKNALVERAHLVHQGHANRWCGQVTAFLR
jgi:hypothetical protein